MNEIDAITRSIAGGTDAEVGKLACPKCSGPLRIEFHSGTRLLSARVTCKNCDFVVRLDGLLAEPPWVAQLGPDFETNP